MSRHLVGFTDVHWTLIGFVIFVLLFLFFVAYTFHPSQDALMRKMERLPLEEDKEGSV